MVFRRVPCEEHLRAYGITCGPENEVDGEDHRLLRLAAHIPGQEG
jgi:hypothetical protein